MVEQVPILISNYNSGDAIELCVESIRRHTLGGLYKLIVFNDMNKNGRDMAYLSDCAKLGWLEYHQAVEHLGHGEVLNRLFKLAGETSRAVLLDCDIQIKGDGWLDEGLSLLGPSILAICDERPQYVIGAEGYCPGFYRAWFAFFNTDAYRDGMSVDWNFSYEDASQQPYADMFSGFASYPKPPGFDPRRVCLDPGSKLWMKVHYDNPRGYQVMGIPSSLRAKFRHFSHVAYFYDVPDDHDDYTRRNKQTILTEIRGELERLRHGNPIKHY